MGNSSCCENNPCYDTELYNMNIRLYHRHNRIHCDDKNLLKKQEDFMSFDWSNYSVFY